MTGNGLGRGDLIKVEGGRRGNLECDGVRQWGLAGAGKPLNHSWEKRKKRTDNEAEIRFSSCLICVSEGELPVTAGIKK